MSKPATGTRTKAAARIVPATELLPKLRKVSRLLRTAICVAGALVEEDGKCCNGAILDLARMARSQVVRLIHQASGAQDAAESAAE